MKKILIVGAGGFGRELLQWIKDINEIKPTWRITGFLDDNPHALSGMDCDCDVVGTVAGWHPAADEEFALAIGNPRAKEKIVRMLKAKGAVFATVIHPTATVTDYSRYGEGLIMFPYAKISVNSRVGDFVTVLSSGIGHDVVVGDYTTISGMCSIMPNVKIGRRVFLAANVAVTYDVAVGDDAYLGLGCIVLKDVAMGVKMFANPARIMPQNDRNKGIQHELS